MLAVDVLCVNVEDDGLVKSASNLRLLTENSMMSSIIGIGVKSARAGSIVRAKEISRSVLFIYNI